MGADVNAFASFRSTRIGGPALEMRSTTPAVGERTGRRSPCRGWAGTSTSPSEATSVVETIAPSLTRVTRPGSTITVSSLEATMRAFDPFLVTATFETVCAGVPGLDGSSTVSRSPDEVRTCNRSALSAATSLIAPPTSNASPVGVRRVGSRTEIRPLVCSATNVCSPTIPI